MATYYVWAPIHHKNEDGSLADLKPGDEVPDVLVKSVAGKQWRLDGTIRTAQYPKDVPPGLSVRTHLLRLANEAHEEAKKIGYSILDTGAENPNAVRPNSESPTAGTTPAPAPTGIPGVTTTES